MSEQFVLRRAVPDDAPVIAVHRRLMFQAMGCHDAERLRLIEAQFIGWARERLAREEYLGWLAIESASGQVVASAGLWVQAWPFGSNNMTGRRGYAMNVYTDPGFRRRGLARRLMVALVDWCKAQEIALIVLNATDDGRPLYESLGFQADNVMIKQLTDF